MRRCLVVGATVLAATCGGGGGTGTDTGLPEVRDASDAAVPDQNAGLDLEAMAPADARDDAPNRETGTPPFQENPAHVLFDLFATPVQAPFPYDYYRDLQTGRIVLDGDAFSGVMLPLVDTFQGFLDAAAQMDGFATYAPLVFLSSVPVDPSSLPAHEAASLAPDASVRLLALDTDGHPASQVPIRVEYRQMDAQDGPRYLVTALPGTLLQPRTTYLFLATDGLHEAGGGPFGRSRGFAEIMGQVAVRPGDAGRAALVERERARLGPLVAGLADADRVVAAVDFTTGDAAAETAAILKQFWMGQAFGMVGYDLDGDGDGAPDVFFSEAYAECPPEGDELAYGVAGVFEPVNLTGPGDEFVKTASGEWKTFTPQRVRFWLMVPRGAMHAPVVLMAHGINSDHSQLCGVARDLARAGLATLRFDLPRHGERGGGAMDFLDLTRPAKIRDNVRQAAADLASLTLLVEALAPELDFLPEGAPDGVADVDAGRIGFLGHSLGGIVGSVFVPLHDRVGPAVINVGGVGLAHMVESYVVPEGMGGMYEIMGMVHLAQHLLYPADGVSFAHLLVREPRTALPDGHPVLVHEHMGDTTVPNVTTELLARFAGIPLLQPYVSLVPGLDVVPAGEATSGLWQVDGVAHGDFVKSSSDPKIGLTRRQAAHFLWTALTTGSPQILSE